MSLGVVDLLEVIEINKNHAEFVAESCRTVDLGFERLIKMARVE